MAAPRKPMNIQEIIHKRNKLSEIQERLSQAAINAYAEAFYVIYAYNSAAISGNSVSLIESKIILDDYSSIGGKSLNEVFELVNHRSACLFMNENLKKEKKINADMILKIHEILMANIESSHLETKFQLNPKNSHSLLSEGEELRKSIDRTVSFVYDNKNGDNIIESAVLLNLEFIKLSPFSAYNGVIAGMLGNYLLLSNGFLPISISNDEKEEYIRCVKLYLEQGDHLPLLNLVYELEMYQLDCYINMEDKNFS